MNKRKLRANYRRYLFGFSFEVVEPAVLERLAVAERPFVATEIVQPEPTRQPAYDRQDLEIMTV